MKKPKGTSRPSTYEVGYGKPPVNTQFQKGRSGNSNGRPKKKTTFIEEKFFQALNERVTVTENGRRKRLTKLEAAFKQLCNRAASGDGPALKTLMQLAT
jgi:hypothetical protein